MTSLLHLVATSSCLAGGHVVLGLDGDALVGLVLLGSGVGGHNTWLATTELFYSRMLANPKVRSE